MQRRAKRPRPPVWEQGRSKTYRTDLSQPEQQLPSVRRLFVGWSLIVAGGLSASATIVLTYAVPRFPNYTFNIVVLGFFYAGQAVFRGYYATRRPVWRTRRRTQLAVGAWIAALACWTAAVIVASAVSARDHGALLLTSLVVLLALAVALYVVGIFLGLRLAGRRPVAHAQPTG